MNCMITSLIAFSLLLFSGFQHTKVVENDAFKTGAVQHDSYAEPTPDSTSGSRSFPDTFPEIGSTQDFIINKSADAVPGDLAGAIILKEDRAGLSGGDGSRQSNTGKDRYQDPQPPVFRGHDLPRLRGVMSPNIFRDEDLRILGTEWNANVIRWQITRNWGKSGTERNLEEYDRWLDGRLVELDQVLESCRRYGIMVIVDMHSPPGGRHENMDLAIFHEQEFQDHFVSLWEKIARRYKDNPVIWGYDLVNEPVQNKPSPPGVADYLGTQVRAAKAIRAIDAKVPIFIEASKWDSADGFRELRPVDVPFVIYQVHMYVPHEFTHQGVQREWKPAAYPGKIGNKVWDKEELRKVLEPVREFQKTNNVHIFVGEFSAIRWAPGAFNYLRDCIDLFEEYGWDWTYHAYREWNGWSVEHSSGKEDNQPAGEPTDRKKLLLDWFSKNVKPKF